MHCTPNHVKSSVSIFLSFILSFIALFLTNTSLEGELDEDGG